MHPTYSLVRAVNNKEVNHYMSLNIEQYVQTRLNRAQRGFPWKISGSLDVSLKYLFSYFVMGTDINYIF